MNCDDDGGDCAALLLNVISTGCPLTHVLSLFRSQSKEDGIINKKEMSYLLAHVCTYVVAHEYKQYKKRT